MRRYPVPLVGWGGSHERLRSSSSGKGPYLASRMERGMIAGVRRMQNVEMEGPIYAQHGEENLVGPAARMVVNQQPHCAR